MTSSFLSSSCASPGRSPCDICITRLFHWSNTQQWKLEAISEIDSDGSTRELGVSDGTNLAPQGLFDASGNLVEGYVVGPFGKVLV